MRPIAQDQRPTRICQLGTGLAPDCPLAARGLRLLRGISVKSVLQPVITPKLNRMLRTLGAVAATHRIGGTIMLASPADSLGMPWVRRDIACHSWSFDFFPPQRHFGKYLRPITQMGEARAGLGRHP